MSLLLAHGKCQGLQPRTYTYDALGNRLTATNQIRFTAAEGFLVEPRRAFSGDRVNILGRNFPAGQNSAVAVTVGGTPAQVLVVSERVITVVLPANLQAGQVTLSVNGGPAARVGDIAVQGVGVAPSVVELDYGAQQQFTAMVVGGSSQTVTWSVTDLRGATARVGSITAGGLYTAIASAGGAADPNFPFLIRATSNELRVSGYALVKLASNNRGPIGNRTMATGTLAAGERHGWAFSGQALRRAYIACLCAGGLADLALRDDNGILVARSGSGQKLKLPDVELPETGQYRIEVYGSASASGSYQLWLDQHAPLPRGVWMFPGDEYWEDGGNWSGGQLPSAGDTAVIDFAAGNITITMAGGAHSCASVRSEERLTLAGGSLTVSGDIQVNNTWRMSGGTLIGAKIQPGTGGEMPLVGGYWGNLFDRVIVNGNLVLSDRNAKLRIAGGLRVNGSLFLRGGLAGLGFLGSQSIAAGTTIVADGTDEDSRLIDSINADTVTIEAGAAIQGRRLLIGAGVAPWSGSLKLLNHGRITAVAAPLVLEIACASFTNTPGGTLESLGGDLRVRAASWFNAGSIVGQSGTIRLGEPDQRQTWINTGAIRMSGGTLYLGGRVTTTGIGLGGLSASNGATVQVNGFVENQGGQLRLTGTNGTWMLAGGTIHGGDVDLQSSSLTLLSYPTNLLDSVVIHGDLLMSSVQSMTRIAGGLRVVGGRVLMTGSNAVLGFQGSQHISVGTTVVAAGNLARIDAVDNATVTVEAGAEVRGQNLYLGSGGLWPGNLTLINEGRIAADVAGGLLDVAGVELTNAPSGLIEAIGGVLTLQSARWTNVGRIAGQNGEVHLGTQLPRGAWTNTGTVQVSGGALYLGGLMTTAGLGLAQISVTNGAQIFLNGVLDNSQGTGLRLAGANGNWILRNGVIRGGTVDVLMGGSLIAGPYTGNLLDSVTINGDLMMPNAISTTQIAGGLRVNGTVRMDGANATLGFLGSQSIAAGTTIVANGLGGPCRIDVVDRRTDTVTLEAGATIQGRALDIGIRALFTGIMTFVNRGVVSVDSAGRIGFGAPITVNEGLMEARSGGTLALQQPLTQRTANAELRLVGGIIAASNTVDVQGGFVSGSGLITVARPGLLQNGGTLRPGGPSQIGRMTIQGDFIQLAGGELAIELGGLVAGTGYDQLAVTETATLAGTLRVTLLGAFAPVATNAFDVLTFRSGSSDFGTYTLPPLGGSLTWTHAFSGSVLRLVVQ